VNSFKVAVGHVGFLNALFEESLPGRTQEQEELKSCLLQRDHVGYRQFLRSLSLDDALRDELEDILRLRGGQEVCEQALAISRSQRARAALQHLCEIWDVLAAYGVQEHVLIDLTMIGDFSYYTGMTFEGYASNLGFPVASGGRYDNLLAQFGRPAPATGFAIKTTRVLEVMEEEPPEPRRTLILYTPAERFQALAAAEKLREAGKIAVTEVVQDPAIMDELLDKRWTDEPSFMHRGIQYHELKCFGSRKGGAAN
jgi:ATP phosphoribosyltransferase regulatory subunit